MRLRYRFELMDLDDRVIAVPLGDGDDGFRGIIKLNGTALSIFKLLNEETTEEAIVESLMKEYNVTHEKVADDVHHYVIEFKERGLII